MLIFSAPLSIHFFFFLWTVEDVSYPAHLPVSLSIPTLFLQVQPQTNEVQVCSLQQDLVVYSVIPATRETESEEGE